MRDSYALLRSEFILIGHMEYLSRPWDSSALPSSIGRVLTAMFVLGEPTSLGIHSWLDQGWSSVPNWTSSESSLPRFVIGAEKELSQSLRLGNI